MQITFTYDNVDVDFPRDGLARASFTMTLAGDTYRVDAEREDDEGWSIDATLDGVDQYAEPIDPKYPHFGYKDKDTYFSRTIELDWLTDWIDEEIFWPVAEAVRDAQQAAIRKMNGSQGTVNWESD